ncbi:MAG: PTS cellobiose transporter subunit IIC [Culicoidibacterales bacterium]
MNLYQKIESKIMVLGDKLNNNVILMILRDAFMLAFPLTIFGSVMLVIANFPYLDALIGIDAVNALKDMLGPAATATMSIATIFVSLGIGYYTSRYKKVEPLFGAAIALVAFFLLTPFDMTTASGEVVTNVLSIERLGAKGMFIGMFASFGAAFLYAAIVKKNWIIKMPPSVPPAVAKSFAALLPALVTLTVFLILRLVFTFTPWENAHDFVYQIIQAPLTALGKGLPATILAILAIQLLWFFGLHGQIIVNSVLDPIWNTLSLENLNAFQVGEVLPNIVNKQFIETFTVGLGGTGMTLAVVIAILLFMKSRQLKEIGKLSAPAAIFNVNEPVIFGMPIVLNPVILIPWIVAPLVATFVAYFAMSSGLVPLTTGVAVPWTTPVFLSGMLATNSWQGGVLQLVQMAIVFVIWFPFLKALDLRNYKQESEEATNTQEF